MFGRATYAVLILRACSNEAISTGIVMMVSSAVVNGPCAGLSMIRKRGPHIRTLSPHDGVSVGRIDCETERSARCAANLINFSLQCKIRTG